jgi:lysophospholipase L1-like esterase
VDITPGSRKAATNPALVAGDGLHPSAAMYAEWAQKALPVVLEALKAGE